MGIRTVITLTGLSLALWSCADVASPSGDADASASAERRRVLGDTGGGDSSPADDPVHEPNDDPDTVADAGSDGPRPDLSGDTFTVADFGPQPDVDTSCIETTATAEPIVNPVDVILFIDTSGSMDQETDKVEEHMDDFARFISGSGIDYRVILIGDEDDVCMPSPPSGGGCPDIDSATFLHVRDKVDSEEGFGKIVEHYEAYREFLRPGAQVHIIGVTDDNDDETVSWFTDRMAGFSSPGFPGGYTFHAIVAQGDLPIFGCCGLTGCGAAYGRRYADLALATGGVSASICTDDWGAVFASIASSVVEGAALPCNYDIPDPGEGLEVDPDRVNLYYTPPGGGRSLVRNVPDLASCAGRYAWYYDRPVDPQSIQLCPALCALADGVVEIEFGCETVKE